MNIQGQMNTPYSEYDGFSSKIQMKSIKSKDLILVFVEILGILISFLLLLILSVIILIFAIEQWYTILIIWPPFIFLYLCAYSMKFQSRVEYSALESI